MTEEEQPGPSRLQSASCKDGICNCGICFDTAKDAVATKCGHLFCWPCLYRWFETKQDCPKCRTPLNQKDYFPFHECGDIEHEDRQDFPPRPTFQRLEPVEIDVDQRENWSTEGNLSDVEDRRNNVLSWLNDQRHNVPPRPTRQRRNVPPRPTGRIRRPNVPPRPTSQRSAKRNAILFGALGFAGIATIVGIGIWVSKNQKKK